MVLGQCRRSIQNLLARVPSSIPSEAERERVSKLYARPFRDACELLLALLRLDHTDPASASLRCGSASANAIAKAVRQLDARFASAEIDLRWRVRLDAEVPEQLRRMSQVAFVLNGYLSEGAGTNLVHVAGTDVD